MTDNDVFSEAVRSRHEDGMTYSRMEATTWSVGGKEGSRSSAWWNNMANYLMDTPPAPKYFPGIAAALGLPQRRVAELVAEQWYGVRPDDGVPSHLRSLITVLRTVERGDVIAIEQMAKHLADKYATISELEELLHNQLAAPAEEPPSPQEDAARG
ncbi:hypothetical protein ACFVX9_03935 [Kitasatospora sp. NPDC058243]|uniref:hypothetical protein n=1 Tax=Kitasatospora sp. NPDC058243 TaxID=3346397 RepID=UPI0036DB289F